MNIWITEDELEEVCSFVDHYSQNRVYYRDWTDKINFVDFAEKIHSKLALISKSEFLNAFVEEYEYEVL